MPRVIKRTARKDYPDQGIKKGDTYYYTKLRLQRGGMVKRSLTPFKPSQLTNSPFKSAFLAAGEDWEASEKDYDALETAANAIRELADEAESSFENMPEGLQQGDTGQLLEERANQCQEIADELDNLASEMEGLDEPEKPEGGEPMDDEAEDFLELSDAWETYQDELTDYEAELDRIRSEAEEQLGNMPE